MKSIRRWIAAGILGVCAVRMQSQETPDMAKGLSAFAAYVPSDIDNYNPANGNIFLKIPLVSLPQRGGKLRLNFYIYDNDKLWTVIGTKQIIYSTPLTINNGGGWDVQQPNLTWGDSSGTYGLVAAGQVSYVGAYIATDQDVTGGSDSSTWTVVYTPNQWNRQNLTTNLNSYAVFTPDGSKHYIGEYFYQTCSASGSGSCPSQSLIGNAVYNYYPATDASGFAPANGMNLASGIVDSAGVTYSGGTQNN